MTDLVSRATREVPRAVLDGRAPTSLAFLYKCSPLLLGAATKRSLYPLHFGILYASTCAPVWPIFVDVSFRGGQEEKP